MLSSLLFTLAFTAVSITSTIPSANSDAVTVQTPDLPEGFFSGRHNPDGSTTLKFPHVNQTFTFEGRSVPTAVRRDTGNGLATRAPFGHSDCWNFQSLSHEGVDRGINEFRALFNSRPDERGYLGGKWDIQYFGYNFDGVYVYFCVNTRERWSDSFDIVDLEHALYWMDQDCGHYVAGYYQWESPSLWGKCSSGTNEGAEAEFAAVKLRDYSKPEDEKKGILE